MKEAVIYGKKMRACTHTGYNSVNGLITNEEILVQIGFIIAEILLFMKFDLTLHFQTQLM